MGKFLILTEVSRERDEKAAIQRKREEEALAKRVAKKAGARSTELIPDRTAPPRSDSSERPSGPPRLALTGNKPTWRERAAQKAAEEAAGGSQLSRAAPPSETATAESQPPKKSSGYVPPAKRGEAPSRGRAEAEQSPMPRDESSGGDVTAKWRAREPSGRDGSSADKPMPRFADSIRRRPESNLREQSPADGPGLSRLGTSAALERDSSIPARSDSPAAASRPAPGKYIPVHLRNKAT